MRAVFALPFEVTEAITENQFHVANRSLQVPKWNGRSAEQPPATFPQKTFAAFEAGNRGLAVFNKGLPEGEVITDKKGKQLYALTLARAVGWLSRNDLKSRRGGAGPMIETPEAQMPGLHTFEFALTTYRGNWRDAGIQPLAHAYAYPPVAFATNEHEGDNLSSYSLARIDDPRIVPSAFHRSHLDGAPIARVYSSADELVQSNIFVPAGSEGAGTTNLLEEHRDTLEYEAGGWPLRLRPWQIQTMRFGRRG